MLRLVLLVLASGCCAGATTPAFCAGPAWPCRAAGAPSRLACGLAAGRYSTGGYDPQKRGRNVRDEKYGEAAGGGEQRLAGLGAAVQRSLELQQGLAAQRERLADLELKLGAWSSGGHQSMPQAREEHARAQSSLASAEAALAQEQTQHQQLQEAHGLMRSRGDELEQSLAQAREEHARAQSSLASAEAALAQEQAQHVLACQRECVLQTRFDALSISVQEERKVHTFQRAGLQAHAQSLRNERTHLSAELLQRKDYEAFLQQEVDFERASNKALFIKVETLEEKMQDMREELAVLQTHIVSNEAELQVRQKREVRGKADLDALRTENINLILERGNALTERKRLAAEMAVEAERAAQTQKILQAKLQAAAAERAQREIHALGSIKVDFEARLDAAGACVLSTLSTDTYTYL